MNVITSVSLFRLHARLVEPYHTAFGDIPFFDAAVAIVRGEGGEGFGESVALPGYSWESPDDVWGRCKSLAQELPGKTLSSAEKFLAPHIHTHPFGVTPLLSALDALSGELSPLEHDVRFPLVGILNVADIADIPQGLERLLEKGFTTVKFKIGFNVEEDIAKTRRIQALLNGKGLLRLDANQHFTLNDARTFAERVSPDGIELFEQPFPAEDWKSIGDFAPSCPYPLMLDESIYGLDEICRAGEHGYAGYIKVKIVKAGGVRFLREQIRQIKKYGMKVVIGNGVATDLSCYLELRAAIAEGVDTAGEMNGYLKLEKPLSPGGLGFSNGHAVLEKQFLIPDLDELRGRAIDTAAFA
ncbi:MAG: hypothetical protein LBO64_07775 [Desulfovibrio sp.]|nr:hypothetical protein [Desulfovibrio sp.]